MRSLADVQSDFYDSHFKDETYNAAKLIVPYGLNGVQRLNIYRNNTFITLTDALSKTYSVVNKLVGDDFFAYTVNHFLEDNLPRPGPIFEFGETFADFLDQFEPAASLTYLSDVARLEWAWNIAYHAAEAIPLTVQNLSDIPSYELIKLNFKLHPSCQFISSQFPIDKIWHANQPNNDIDKVELDEAVEILIIRPSESVNIHRLNPSIIHFLTSLNKGQNVEQAFSTTIKIDPDFNPAETIINLMDIGVFVEFNINQQF